jgi:hypothetical protein
MSATAVAPSAAGGWPFSSAGHVGGVGGLGPIAAAAAAQQASPQSRGSACQAANSANGPQANAANLTVVGQPTTVKPAATLSALSAAHQGSAGSSQPSPPSAISCRASSGGLAAAKAAASAPAFASKAGSGRLAEDGSSKSITHGQQLERRSSGASASTSAAAGRSGSTEALRSPGGADSALGRRNAGGAKGSRLTGQITSQISAVQRCVRKCALCGMLRATCLGRQGRGHASKASSRNEGYSPDHRIPAIPATLPTRWQGPRRHAHPGGVARSPHAPPVPAAHRVARARPRAQQRLDRVAGRAPGPQRAVPRPPRGDPGALSRGSAVPANHL